MKRTWAKIIRYAHRLEGKTFGLLEGDERKAMQKYLRRKIERTWDGIPPDDTVSSRIYFGVL